MALEAVEILDMPLDLTEADVWAVLGTPGNSHPGLAAEVEDSIEIALRLCTPRGILRRSTASSSPICSREPKRLHSWS